MDAQERWCSIALSLCPGIERGTVRKLAAVMGGAAHVWNASVPQWLQGCNMRPDTARRLDNWRRSFRAENIENQLLNRGVWCMVRGDENYPVSLLDLMDPPLVLFGMGDARYLAGDVKKVAVIGTRRASGYGLECANWIAKTLADNGVTVVSGLALGIDAAAHNASVCAPGSTVAVLASGVDVCYPSSNRGLYENILRAGALVSEYAPSAVAAKHRFPERNRLIAALSSHVVVVQAGEKSGALRTVDAALELGRDVYVVPGPITSVHFRGSHRLLQQGAQVLVDPNDVLLDLNVTTLQTSLGNPQRVPERWSGLYELLTEAITAQDLARQLAVPPAHVYSGLLELELLGAVQRLPGGFYRRGAHK